MCVCVLHVFVMVHAWMHACMMRAHCDYKGGDTCTCIFRPVSQFSCTRHVSVFQCSLYWIMSGGDRDMHKHDVGEYKY